MAPFKDLVDVWEQVIAVLIFVALLPGILVAECVPKSRVLIDDLAKSVGMLMLAVRFRAGVTVEGALAKASITTRAVKITVSEGCIFVDKERIRNCIPDKTEEQ